MNIDFSTKSKKELIEFCKNNGIKKYSSLTRDGIIELIKANEKNTPLEYSKIESTTDLFEKLNVNEAPSDGMRFIDLFCGIGGFHQAFKNIDSNSKCVFACEID